MVPTASFVPQAPCTNSVTVTIGDVPILLDTPSGRFPELLALRYAGFLGQPSVPAYRLQVHLCDRVHTSTEDVRVVRRDHCWMIERGDFQAELNLATRTGWVRQTENPYAIDTVLRIAHSLILAEEGSFLLHAASVVRNRRAFLFAGVSGAGKTTICRLAPAEAAILSDEISYVRRGPANYLAYGTPFAGELARVGENLCAPIERLFLLEQGPQHRIEPVSQHDAARSLLRHMLFFAHDQFLVQRVLEGAVEFVSRVPVARLTFAPDPGVWDVIR